jgi:hypothetical protein
VTIDPAEPKEATLARFDPVLRALVAFGLVEHDPEHAEHDGEDGRPDGHENGNGQGAWRLIPAVQRRLESLVAPAPPAEKLIYFGHRCAACGEHAPTRMHSGVLLCDACRQEPPPPLRDRAADGPQWPEAHSLG